MKRISSCCRAVLSVNTTGARCKLFEAKKVAGCHGTRGFSVTLLQATRALGVSNGSDPRRRNVTWSMPAARSGCYIYFWPNPAALASVSVWCSERNYGVMGTGKLWLRLLKIWSMLKGTNLKTHLVRVIKKGWETYVPRVGTSTIRIHEAVLVLWDCANSLE